MRIAVVGSGPAALMAADRLALAGIEVCVFEKRPGLAWKLYVAGSSGLNITNGLPTPEFVKRYSGPEAFWSDCLTNFGPSHWLQFIESHLQIGTFLGTSGRYFVETMHAAKLVRSWRRRLEDLKVRFHCNSECTGFQIEGNAIKLLFSEGPAEYFDRVCFALGGASWEAKEIPLRWPDFFKAKGLGFREFSPANTGYELAWPASFLREVEGQPLKNILFTSPRGAMRGDLVITSYGLEGTPIYTFGALGPVTLDLKPDLSANEIQAKLKKTRENLAPLRRASKLLKLNPAARALLFHCGGDAAQSLDGIVGLLKNFPLELIKQRPLTEAISSSGGILWTELDPALMLKSYPNIYCIGEMLDWEAPTGGFLIQGCVSQGAWCAQNILDSL